MIVRSVFNCLVCAQATLKVLTTARFFKRCSEMKKMQNSSHGPDKTLLITSLHKLSNTLGKVLLFMSLGTLLSGNIATAGQNAAPDSPLIVKSLNEEKFSSGSTVCAVLNDDMENSPKTGDLKAYLEVLDKNGKQIEGLLPFAREHSLCVSGLKGGEEYSLHFKKGLISANGFELRQDEVKKITLSDVRPHLELEPGTLLPKSVTDSTVYVTSVNIPNIKATLYYIEKNTLLDSEFADHLLSDNLQNWELWPLVRNHARKLAEQNINTMGKRNESIATPVDFASLCGKTPDDGVYLLTVSDSLINDENAQDFPDRTLSRLIVVSDLGVTAYRSDNSIKITVRSLKSANPVPGAQITLLSRGNFELYKDRTDADGFATVPYDAVKGKDASRPAAIAVSHGSDFFMLPIEGQADLSLQSLTGNEDRSLPFTEPTDLRVMGFFDRGIAKGGESVHFTALVRDHKLQAAKLDALIVKLRRSDGAVWSSKTLKAKGSGFFEADFLIPKQGPFGTWFAESYIGNRQLSQNTILISNYTPQELSIRDESGKNSFNSGEKINLSIQASYNYGAAAQGLSADASCFTVNDPHPFRDGILSSYTFGPSEQVSNEENWQQDLSEIILGKDGRGHFHLQLPDLIHAKTLNFTSRVFANGNSASLNTKYQVFPHVPLIGIKHNEDNLEMICVDPFGKVLNSKLHYTIFRIIRDYQYVLDGGSWKFIAKNRRYPVSTSELESKDGKVLLPIQDLNDGEYLINVNASGGNSSLSFTKGYSLLQNANLSPDRFEVTCDKKTYQPQDKIKLSFISPAAGTADLLLGSNDIVQSRRFDVKKGENSIDIKADESFGAGVHALISISTPAQKIPSPVRSFGLTFIHMNSQNKKLPLNIEAPSTARSDEKITIKLDVPESSGTVHYTASLVDEGILRLTSHKLADPYAFFTSAPFYDLKIADLSSRLLHAFGENGQGYGMGNVMENLVDKQTSFIDKPYVILEQGVRQAQDGKASIEFKIPKYQGALKLTVTAADDQAFAAYEKIITVREEAIPSLGLPADMYRNDEAKLAFDLHNLELDDENFDLSLHCDEGLQCSTIDKKHLTVKKGEHLSFNFKAKAVKEGNGSITYTLTNGKFSQKDTIKTAIHSPVPSVFNQSTQYIDAKERALIKPTIPLDKTQNSSLSFGPLPFLDRQALLHTLNKADLNSYQLQDKALILRSLLACQDSQKFIPKISELFEDLVARTDASAFFTAGDEYTQILACHALLQCVKAGFYLAPEMQNGLRARLNSAASYSWEPVKSLALESLASLGDPNLSQLRYSYELAKGQELSPLTAASYAKAFTMTGDELHAKEALYSAVTGLERLIKLNKQITDAKTQDALTQALLKRNNFENASLSSTKYDCASILEAAVLSDSLELLSKLDLKSLLDGVQPGAVTAQLLKSALACNEVSSQTVKPKDGGFEAFNQEDHALWGTLSTDAYPGLSNASKANFRVNAAFLNKDGSALKEAYTLNSHEETVLLLKLERKASGNSDLVIRGALPSGTVLYRILDEELDQKTFGNLVTPKILQRDGNNFTLILDADRIKNLQQICVGLSFRADLCGRLAMPALCVEDPAYASLDIYRLSDYVTVK